MDATRDEQITALEVRVAGLAATQKKMFDAVLVLGLASAAWDPEDVARTLRELADELERSDPAGSFVNHISRDARAILRTLS